MNNFILVTNDKTSNKNSYEILLERLSKKEWEIYHQTPNKDKLIKNSEVLFYLAGQNELSQHFIARGTIAEIHKSSVIEKNFFYSTLKLEDIEIFKKPIDVKKIKDKVDFIKNKPHYGLAFVGGCISISNIDFELITKYS